MFTACLPTALMRGVYRCVLMGAAAWARQRLQMVCFWFQIMLSNLVAAMGVRCWAISRR